jgi:hypothetical protein
MREIHWFIEMSLEGCERSGVLMVEDNATDAEIEEEVRDEVFDKITWGWAEKGDDELKGGGQ